MSGISGINSSAISSLYSTISSSEEVSKSLTNGAEMLDTTLEEEGIDEETRTAIQEELAAAIAEMLTANDGEMPTPDEMKTTIDGVLAEYGLDADELMAKAAPMGPPPTESSEESETQTLFDILAAAEEESEQSGDDVTQTASELSQLIMDYLIGIDEEA